MKTLIVNWNVMYQVAQESRAWQITAKKLVMTKKSYTSCVPTNFSQSTQNSDQRKSLGTGRKTDVQHHIPLYARGSQTYQTWLFPRIRQVSSLGRFLAYKTKRGASYHRFGSKFDHRLLAYNWVTMENQDNRNHPTPNLRNNGRRQLARDNWQEFDRRLTDRLSKLSCNMWVISTRQQILTLTMVTWPPASETQSLR